ncbi:sensor histidine kinase [Nocardia sp. NPDC057227]|uniref:sensor histidine kinase n=1 Tax=Nocardia sp. NPDC057227 TaxID=3346056 RepID=UPI0036274E99
MVLLAAVEALAASAHLIGGTGTGAGAAVSAVLLLWATFRLATDRPVRWWPVRDVTVAAVYVLATPVLVDGPEFTTVGTPMLAVGATAVVAMAISCSPLRSLSMALVVVGCWAAGAARVPGVGNPLTIFNLDFVLVEWAMAATLRALVLRAAANTDIAQAELAYAETVAEVATARERAEREAWATMHDTAAATLAMLAHGVRVPAGILHAQLRRDLRALRRAGLYEGNPSIELPQALAELGESTRTPVRYVGPETLQVPSEIGRAVLAAAREALTNVDRHAAASEVSIRLAHDRLVIADDGVGFDPADPRAVGARYGVRNSIRRRLADAGVAVEIRSAPGGGTEIDIDWHSIPHTSPGPAKVDHSERLLGGYRYGLVLVAAIVTAIQSPLGLAAAHPTGQSLVLAVVLAITVIAVVDARWEIPMLMWWATMVTAVVAGPIQVTLLDSADFATGANWAVGALGWHVAAMSGRRPTWASMWVLAILWGGEVVVVISHSGQTRSSVALVYAVISVATLQALAIWFSNLLRVTVRDSEAALTGLTEVRAAAAVREALHHDNLVRLRQLSSELVPLLTGLLHTDDPAGNPAVRAKCLIESARLRRMFDPVEVSAHPLIDELTVAISAAERRGVVVKRSVIGAVPLLSAPARSSVLAAPMILLEGARTRARVVLIGAGARDEPPTLSVTCDCSAAARDAAKMCTPDGVVVAAGELVWTTVPLA